MNHEVETKILNVNRDVLAERFLVLGAEKILATRLTVDWFRPEGVKEGEEDWFLRIRTSSEGATEVTWKGKSEKLGASRRHKEINVKVPDHETMAALFEAIGLARYAHQEKDRTSWRLKDWRFDLDQYPGMPAYLEIEGTDEAHIQEAISLLNLRAHEACSEGERILIQTKYGLDWYAMKF